MPNVNDEAYRQNILARLLAQKQAEDEEVSTKAYPQADPNSFVGLPGGSQSPPADMASASAQVGKAQPQGLLASLGGGTATAPVPMGAFQGWKTPYSQMSDTEGMGLKGLLTKGVLGKAKTAEPIPEEEETPDRAATETSNKKEVPEEESKSTLAIPEEAAKSNTFATQENLDKAQQAQKFGLLASNFASGGNLIGAGIAGATPQPAKEFQGIADIGTLATKQLDEKIALEKKDPSSDYSKGLRDFLGRFGMKAPENMSAETAEKIAPWALSQYNNMLHRETQKEITAKNREEKSREFDLRLKELNLKQQALADAKAEHAQQRQQLVDDKSFQKLNDITNPANASSRKVLGTAGAKIQSIEGAMALLDGRDLDKVDSREYAEVVRILDRVLSNAAPSIYGQKKLTADTAAGRVKHFIEFFAGTPQGAAMAPFIEKARNTLVREADVSEQQVMKNLKTAMPFYKGLETRNPDQFKEATDAVRNNIFTPRTKELLDKYRAEAAAMGNSKSSGKPTSTPEGKVLVLSPEGLQGFIPKERLKAYMDNGYKQVQ